MYRLTRPSISFAASSILLKERLNHPVLSADMLTTDRLYAIWDDLPWTLTGKSNHEKIEWIRFATYELGVRRYAYGTTKGFWLFMNLFWAVAIFCILDSGWLHLYYAYSGGQHLAHLSLDYGTEFTQKWHGIDVYCADGKFVRPFFHLFPPMYTMTLEDIDD